MKIVKTIALVESNFNTILVAFFKDRQMTEIHQFAMAYVRDIISKAIVLASERESTFTSLKSGIIRKFLTFSSHNDLCFSFP